MHLTQMRFTVMTFALLIAVTSAAADAASPSATVACDAVKVRPASLDRSHRFILGRVAFRRTPVLQISHIGGGLAHWSRTPVFIRSRTPVTISVPKAWRDRVAMTWGSAVTHTLRFAPCPTPANLSPHRWNGYDGGFRVREPACVPLRVRVGERVATVRFGVGRAC